MKKIIAILFLFSIILSLTSCTNPDYNIFQPKDIVLGNEVDSVELITNQGEKITFDNTADFYEIFDKIGFEYKDGKKYSFTAEIELEDTYNHSINMNSYHFDCAEFYEFRAKKVGDNNVALGEMYLYDKSLGDDGFLHSSFERSMYKNEKAFGGMESDKNGYLAYASDVYSMIPSEEIEFLGMRWRSELWEMYHAYGYFLSLMQLTKFFEYIEPFVTNTEIFDVNDFVTREYELYENYIVFKQTSPFLSLYGSSAIGQDAEIIYKWAEGADCSITQEAYYNVKTGEIELIRVYGDTLWHTGEYLGRELKINMQMYTHDIDESEFKEKSDGLIDYVKSNTKQKKSND